MFLNDKEKIVVHVDGKYLYHAIWLFFGTWGREPAQHAMHRCRHFRHAMKARFVLPYGAKCLLPKGCDKCCQDKPLKFSYCKVKQRQAVKVARYLQINIPLKLVSIKGIGILVNQHDTILFGNRFNWQPFIVKLKNHFKRRGR